MTLWGHVTRDPNKGAILQKDSGTMLPSISRDRHRDKRASRLLRKTRGRVPDKGRGSISQTAGDRGKRTPDLGSPLVKVYTRGRLICRPWGGYPSKAKVPLRYPRGDYTKRTVTRKPYIRKSGAIRQMKGHESDYHSTQ